jgi:hypothetical protein
MKEQEVVAADAVCVDEVAVILVVGAAVADSVVATCKSLLLILVVPFLNGHVLFLKSVLS